MANSAESGTVPPFYNKPTQPQRSMRATRYRILSQFAMLVGWATLTIAMVGGAKFLWDILTDGLISAGVVAKVISLGLAFLLGWVVSVVCIRALGNLVLPSIINFYIFLTTCGILVLYGRVVFKLYDEAFKPEHYLRYSLALGTGFAVLIGLHLLIEDHDLRPFSIPVLLGGVMHLFSMVAHYVFLEGNSTYILGDMYFFAVLMVIVALMLAHFGIFNLIRRIIDGFFVKSGTSV